MVYYLVCHSATGATITIVIAPGPEYTDKYTEQEYQKEYNTNGIRTWCIVVPVGVVVSFGGSQLGVFSASFFSCIFCSIVLLLPVIAAIMSL